MRKTRFARWKWPFFVCRLRFLLWNSIKFCVTNIICSYERSHKYPLLREGRVTHRNFMKTSMNNAILRVFARFSAIHYPTGAKRRPSGQTQRFRTGCESDNSWETQIFVRHIFFSSFWSFSKSWLYEISTSIWTRPVSVEYVSYVSLFWTNYPFFGLPRTVSFSFLPTQNFFIKKTQPKKQFFF